MRSRIAPAIAIALICVPAAVAAVEAVTYYTANRSTHTIVSSGITREYNLHVPPTYDRNTPAPLVITMHGASLWGAAQEEISQWDRVADREGVIVAYPSGRAGFGPRAWHAVEGDDTNIDVRFIADLIDALEQTYNIDATRIYANGLSNGGGMSFVLSCAMSDRIAAVGLVASAQLLPWTWCKGERPVPMINFHGTDDSAAPYLGGKSWVVTQVLPATRTWTASWARRNGCEATPAESRIASDVTRLQYTKCARNADVTLYTIEGGGHTWPGGGYFPEWFVGRSTNSIDASNLMWEFFKEHPLTPRH